MPSKPPKAANASLAQNRLSNTFSITEGQEADVDAVILPRDLIDPDPDQPRQFFDPQALRELGADMKTHALKPLQAILVRPHPEIEGRFMLVAGERRWRASAPEYGNIERLRCTLRNLTEEEVALIQGAENDKRADTSVIAKGRNFRRLKAALGDSATWNDVAMRVGRSELTVLRHVRLLRLPREVQDFIDKNTLSEKHGRAFLALQPSGNGLAGQDLSGSPGNKNQRRLIHDIERTLAEGKSLTGDDAIKLAEEYIYKTPEPHDDERHNLYEQAHKSQVEEEAAQLRDKNKAALDEGDTSKQSAPLQLIAGGSSTPAPQGNESSGGQSTSSATPSPPKKKAEATLSPPQIIEKWLQPSALSLSYAARELRRMPVEEREGDTIRAACSELERQLKDLKKLI